MILAEKIYVKTRKFPPEERYGLTSQMRRAAVSVPSNIAEGSQRSTKKEFANFLLIAKGSLAELETQVRLSFKLSYLNNLDAAEIIRIIDDIRRMIRSYRSTMLARI